jgi:RND family efflux transporter MFP subunit
MESAMSVANIEKPRDPLSTLRIARNQPPRRSRPRYRWLRRFIILIVLIGLAAAAVYAASVSGKLDLLEALEPRLEVRVATVSVETGRAADATVVATGYLESRRQAMIGARAPGRIEILNVEEGSRVKKGELLAALEHADLDAALAAAKAEVTRTRAEVAEQKVEIGRTRREYERAVKLHPTRAVTEAEFDDAKFQYEAAVAKIESLKAAVELAEARVREAEQLKENMFVRAPFDGTVISKDAEVGESIMPGGMGVSSGRGSVVTIADLERLEVDCDVKEDYIGRVVSGRPAEIAVDAVPDRRYKGRVRKIIPMGDRARATIKVKVEITDADERLFPDMSGTVYFLPDETERPEQPAERRIFCPTDAIVRDGEMSHVWVVDEEDRVQRSEVKIGGANDGRTEILGGLDGGERVVVSPPPDLRDRQLVKVSE